MIIVIPFLTASWLLIVANIRPYMEMIDSKNTGNIFYKLLELGSPLGRFSS